MQSNEYKVKVIPIDCDRGRRGEPDRLLVKVELTLPDGTRLGFADNSGLKWIHKFLPAEIALQDWRKDLAA